MDFELHKKQKKAFLSDAFEILYGGAAGGGKSHLLRVFAISFCVAIDSLQVYLFRRKSTDLAKNHLDGANGFRVMLKEFTESGWVKITTNPNEITFWNGSKIFLCHCQYEKDKYNYQGAEIDVLLIDELTHFTRTIYSFLRGRCRTVKERALPAGITLPKAISGTNPGGVGHNWVKADFVDNAPQGGTFIKEIKLPNGEIVKRKCEFIPSLLEDNPSLDYNTYAATLADLGNPALVKAMLNGDWNIVSGGMFDDLWNPDIHVVEPFKVPSSWYIDRSFDWGSSKPYSVGFWAESDGTDIQLADGTIKSTVRGDLYRIGEIYGWNGEPNQGTMETAAEVATKVRDYEKAAGIKVYPGPADSSIYTTENDNCIADDMAKEGIHWEHANKSPGSRANGWENMRNMLKNASSIEKPGLYVFNTCRQFIRTIPTLPRDTRNPDDIDTNAEDHIADEARYRILSRRDQFSTPKVKGLRG